MDNTERAGEVESWFVGREGEVTMYGTTAIEEGDPGSCEVGVTDGVPGVCSSDLTEFPLTEAVSLWFVAQHRCTWTPTSAVFFMNNFSSFLVSEPLNDPDRDRDLSADMFEKLD